MIEQKFPRLFHRISPEIAPKFTDLNLNTRVLESYQSLLTILSIYLLFDSFDRIMTRHRNKTSFKPPTGRPPALSADSIASLQKAARERDLAQNSFTTRTLTEAIQKQRIAQLKAAGLNTAIRQAQLSKSARRYYRSKIAPDTFHAAKLKNPTRTRALREIYNPISAAGVVSLLQDCPPETFVSIDSVGVRLGDKVEDRRRVHLAKGSRAYLGDRNRLPGVSAKQRQFRIAHCLVAHTASGTYRCAVQIVDNVFTEVSVHDISEEISVWFLPKSYDRDAFFTRFLLEYVIPCVNTERIKLASLPTVSSTSSSQTSSTASTADEYKRIRAILSFDGESSQIAAATSSALLDKCKEEKIELLKWAAATSLVQQPADIGKMHLLLHTYYDPVNGEVNSAVVIPSTKMTRFINDVFMKTKVSSASKDTFKTFLKHIETALDKSFNKASISRAWQMAGYFPYSAQQIMSGFSNWPTLSSDVATTILKYEAL